MQPGKLIRFNEEISCRVIVELDMYIADAPARSDGLNMVHHNGQYSCPDCMEGGEYVNALRARKFPYRPYHELQLPANNEVAEDARNNVIPQFGVKPGEQTLARYGLELPRDSPPEPMHVLWEGVVKDVINILLSRRDILVNESRVQLERQLRKLHLPIQLASGRFDSLESHSFHVKHYKLFACSIGALLLKSFVPICCSL